jgi:hypothetical protein
MNGLFNTLSPSRLEDLLLNRGECPGDSITSLVLGSNPSRALCFNQRCR